MDVYEMYQEICEHATNMTDWELSFIENIGDRVDECNLSPGQQETIERIYYDRC